MALAGCSGPSARSLYPPLTERLVAAVNYQYNAGNARSQPAVSFSISSASVPPNEAAAARSAAREAVQDCNEGVGTRIVAVGLVRSTLAKQPIFAVFMNPPGQHTAPSAEPLSPSHPRLNWYAAFVSSPKQPFCTFGHSPSLPALPVH